MLSSYVNAIFAVPENPVMRAVSGYQVMPPAGATTQPLQTAGLGCACGIKPFGLGNVHDEGLRLYGDFYGAQQHGGMVLNGDRAGLGAAPPGFGTYWGVPKTAGMGDISTMLSNLANGEFNSALTGEDLIGGFPNWIVLPVGLWLLFSVIGDTKRGYKNTSGAVRKYKARRKRVKAAKETLASDSGFF